MAEWILVSENHSECTISSICTANFIGSLLTSKLLICSYVLYIVIHNAKHTAIRYTLIVFLCVCGLLQERGQGNRGWGYECKLHLWQGAYVKLQTKCNTNWQIMIMFALESIPKPTSSPSRRPQFFYTLMSNNAKEPVVCLLMVCITVSQESNEKWSDTPLKSMLLHRYKTIGQTVDWRYPLIFTASLHDPLAWKILILVIFWYSMPQRMLLSIFQKFFQTCSQLHVFH